MGMLGVEKIIDYLIKRGWAFIVMWTGAIWLVWQTESVLGVILSASDKGLIFVIVTLLCIMAHHFVAYWAAKRRYFNPKNYTDKVYADVQASRDYLQSLPIYSQDMDEWGRWFDTLRVMEHNIPDGKDRELFKSVVHSIGMNHFYNNYEVKGEESSVTAKFRSTVGATIAQLKPRIKAYLKQTEWVMRK